MNKRSKGLANTLALISFFFGSFHWWHEPVPTGYLFWLPKSLAGALSPLFALIGTLGAFLGVRSGSRLAVIAGSAGAASAISYFRGVTMPQPIFSKFFTDCRNHMGPQQKKGMLARRWVGWMSPGPEPRVLRDLTYAVLPDSSRSLLCDLWLPPEGVPQTGLAFVYSHGSAWYSMDKDVGTRSFFRRLAGQGHVVMDLAYRLAPETDMTGMVGDVLRGLAWIKQNARTYGINPGKVVVGGGSAGGQLSLLAAYAPYNPTWLPEDLQDVDLSVAGVISEYGPTDLEACYYYTNQDVTTRDAEPGPRKEPFSPPWYSSILKRLDGAQYERLGLNKPSDTGAFVRVLGSHPNLNPEPYWRFSPVSYVQPGLPPTLLIQGDHDMYVSLEATGELYLRLREAGVIVVHIVLPLTEHGFDLMLPSVSPSAQAGLYYIERFLACLL